MQTEWGFVQIAQNIIEVLCKNTTNANVNISSHKLGKISLEQEHTSLVMRFIVVVILCYCNVGLGINYLDIAFRVVATAKLKGDEATAADGKIRAGKHAVRALHAAHNVLNACEEESAVLVIGLIGILPENVLTGNVGAARPPLT